MSPYFEYPQFLNEEIALAEEERNLEIRFPFQNRFCRWLSPMQVPKQEKGRDLLILLSWGDGKLFIRLNIELVFRIPFPFKMGNSENKITPLIHPLL